MPKSEVDEFLDSVSDKPTKANNDFIQDDSDPLAVKEEGTKKDEVDTDTDDKGADDTDKDDKPLPYHKDPKLQRYIEKEIGKRTKAVAPAPAAAVAPASTEDELTDTLIEIIGNDTPQKLAAVKKFRAQLGRLEERGAEKALSQIREQAEAEQAEERKERETLVSAFDSLEEEFDVDLTSNTTKAAKERNEFIEFIKRVAPKDEEGEIIQYPDFSETYKLFKSTQKPTTDNKRAKDVASRSMTRSTDSGAAPTKGNSWKDVDRLFAKMQ